MWTSRIVRVVICSFMMYNVCVLKDVAEGGGVSLCVWPYIVI